MDLIDIHKSLIHRGLVRHQKWIPAKDLTLEQRQTVRDQIRNSREYGEKFGKPDEWARGVTSNQERARSSAHAAHEALPKARRLIRRKMERTAGEMGVKRPLDVRKLPGVSAITAADAMVHGSRTSAGHIRVNRLMPFNRHTAAHELAHVSPKGRSYNKFEWDNAARAREEARADAMAVLHNRKRLKGKKFEKTRLRLGGLNEVGGYASAARGRYDTAAKAKHKLQRAYGKASHKISDRLLNYANRNVHRGLEETPLQRRAYAAARTTRISAIKARSSASPHPKLGHITWDPEAKAEYIRVRRNTGTWREGRRSKA